MHIKCKLEESSFILLSLLFTHKAAFFSYTFYILRMMESNWASLRIPIGAGMFSKLKDADSVSYSWYTKGLHSHVERLITAHINFGLLMSCKEHNIREEIYRILIWPSEKLSGRGRKKGVLYSFTGHHSLTGQAKAHRPKITSWKYY